MPRLRRRLLSLGHKALAAAGYQLVPRSAPEPDTEPAPVREPEPPPLRQGDPAATVARPFLDSLPDDELIRLNELLPWAAFVIDAHGRRFGRPWSAVKRNTPTTIPDPRLLAWDDAKPLKDRSVLEVGCFEGLHTATLCHLGARVTAIDARVENIAKTLVRCALLDAWPRAHCWNLEGEPPAGIELGWDRVSHIGVLYHLTQPLEHLAKLASWTREGILLDTHVAPPEHPTEEISAGPLSARAWVFREKGRDDPFAGMEPLARWIVEEDLLRVLAELGFRAEVIERRDERNGPRLQIHAWR